MISERFEWDDMKAAYNEERHGVSFGLAEQIFDDPLNITIHDRFHSNAEDRYVTIGGTMFNEVLVVVHGAPRSTRNDVLWKKNSTPSTTQPTK